MLLSTIYYYNIGVISYTDIVSFHKTLVLFDNCLQLFVDIQTSLGVDLEQACCDKHKSELPSPT